MAGAECGQDGDDRQGLDPLLAQGAQAQAPRRLESLPPAASAISGRWAKPVAGLSSAAKASWRRGVGDMVLAADDVADAEVDIVDGRGEQVGGAAVLAPDRRGR